MIYPQVLLARNLHDIRNDITFLAALFLTTILTVPDVLPIYYMLHTNKHIYKINCEMNSRSW